MTWTPIQRSGNRRAAFNRVTMACSQAGRHKAWSVRITIRSAPDWLAVGTMADVHIGSGDVAGKIRITQGTEHNVRAMPTPGKAPTGVVFLQFGPWDGFTPTIQKPTECEYEDAADGVIVSLPPWAMASRQCESPRQEIPQEPQKSAPKQSDSTPEEITAPVPEITAPNPADEPEEIGTCAHCGDPVDTDVLWMGVGSLCWCSKECFDDYQAEAAPKPIAVAVDKPATAVAAKPDPVDRSPPVSVPVARPAPAPRPATVPPPSPSSAPAPTPATPHAFARLAQMDVPPKPSDEPRRVPLPATVSVEATPRAATQVIRLSLSKIRDLAMGDGATIRDARDLQKYNQRREAAGLPIYVLPIGSRIGS